MPAPLLRCGQGAAVSHQPGFGDPAGMWQGRPFQAPCQPPSLPAPPPAPPRPVLGAVTGTPGHDTGGGSLGSGTGSPRQGGLTLTVLGWVTLARECLAPRWGGGSGLGAVFTSSCLISSSPSVSALPEGGCSRRAAVGGSGQCCALPGGVQSGAGGRWEPPGLSHAGSSSLALAGGVGTSCLGFGEGRGCRQEGPSMEIGAGRGGCDLGAGDAWDVPLE